MLESNEHKLPLFYQSMNENEVLDEAANEADDESILSEFVVSCLLDPKFPAFVQKVENVLNKALKD